MSLMKSLARVAAGVMLAKGIGAVMKGAQGGATGRSSGGLLDQLTRGVTGRDSRSAGGMSGGLGDILGQVLGGGSPASGNASPYGGAHSPSGRATGGLGGILDQLTAGQGGGGAAGGGLGQILAGGAAAGGLGGILGGLLGGSQAQAETGGLAHRGSQPTSNASFGEVFNQALVRGDEPETQPTPEQNALAGLMLKAMIQAAKSDGKIDEAEQERLTQQLGELDDEERRFIREQMAAPVDVTVLAREVPKGAGPHVYLMSLMAIDFDSRAEAEYLHSLATALGLDRDVVNGIHQQVGTTTLYT